ncbi:aminotransferase class I/II-fold pyridoxal phosphate-dependent enzyme [Patescibacteria group bacterium]|nr:aminotransferase class I/II-fold pyridoxal phosphate-dependent enzyme [Patescibacteria group bacterium]MBU1721967.1 aminotransferase class I/II-fold pyridoxal phosphate-dependent enzyme [Patescibacteria group bacterium]MBU1901285.1 aminotransferase class I/II-fold pyridoxal phosphate-dependent enzyme [Patescibacteria group bacterium]
MIFTGFLPNSTKQDLNIALSYLFSPTQWSKLQQGPAIKKSEQMLREYFSVEYASTFDSGRTALQKAIEAIGVQKGDEVIVQAYTCVVVTNAIIWAGAIPIYVDVGKDLNMDLADLSTKITPKTKAIIVQHTFGNPAAIDTIMGIAKEKEIMVVEDCAHAIGGEYKGKKLGTWGDIGMFSFGSDKVISCVRGGALTTNTPALGKKIKELQQALPFATKKNILQYLFNIPLFLFGKKYYESIGKLAFYLSNTLHLTGRVIYDKEKCGEQIRLFPAKLPNALADMLVHQLHDLDARNTHRQHIAAIYKKAIQTKTPLVNTGHIFLRYTLFVDEPKKLLAYAKEQGIMLGNWYNASVVPTDVREGITRYTPGSCPQAEAFAKKSINLPTHKDITEKEAQIIIDCLDAYARS